MCIFYVYLKVCVFKRKEIVELALLATGLIKYVHKKLISCRVKSDDDDSNNNK
jgi:hypothetical protein